jgi:hypothetical protein
MSNRQPGGHAAGAARVGATCATLLLALAAAAPADDGVADLIARMDARYAQRQLGGALVDQVALGDLALAIAPDAAEVEWRLGRAFFAGAADQPNRILRRALAGQAMAWAGRAREHAPERVEGHYYYAVATGVYALTIGIMRALSDGVAGSIESAGERALALDPDFLDGAPGVLLGRYYFSLPWPRRDLARSRTLLEAVARRHPGKLVARVYLAETCHALDDDERARTELRAVLAAPATPVEAGESPPHEQARLAWREWFGDEPP